MFARILNSKIILGLVAASVAAVGIQTQVAHAAFSATVVSDSGDTHTIATPASPALPIDMTTTTSPIYGTPVITDVGGTVTISFSALSPNFAATANTSTYGASEFVDTDGRLSILLHFDQAISLTALIAETGSWSATGSGSVNDLGGGVAIEAINPIPVETKAGFLAFTENSSTAWSSTATITGFNGSYTDYQLTIDNDLFANAPLTGNGGSATIAKNTVTITIPGGGSSRTPEPASLGILAVGGAAIMARRRK